MNIFLSLMLKYLCLLSAVGGGVVWWYVYWEKDEKDLEYAPTILSLLEGVRVFCCIVCAPGSSNRTLRWLSWNGAGLSNYARTNR